MSRPQPGQRSSLLAQGRLKLSELFPLMSRSRAPLSSAFIVPIMLTLLLVVVLMSTTNTGAAIALLVALSLVGLVFLNVLCGRPRPWWWSTAGYLVALGVLVLELLLDRPVISRFVALGRIRIPEGIDPLVYINGHGFLTRFRMWLFVAGLPEELLKAVPVAMAAVLGRLLPSPWRQRVGVLNPLDGVLLGAAAGAGFILVEAYIYGIDLSTDWGEAFIQILVRTIGSVGMHSAYSGVFGYYIGLSVMNRRLSLPIVLAGWLLSSVMHAFWNASNSAVLSFLIGVASYALMASSVLKAQQSVMRSPAAPPPAPVPRPEPAREATPAADSPPSAPPGRSVRLQVGARVLVLRPGDTVHAHQLPGFDHTGADGTVGEVVENPTDPSVWGLRNRSAVEWHAVVKPGDQRTVRPGHSVRLASGVTLRIGAVTIAVE